MQDGARRVCRRSAIEVHYVDINNSAQKCHPSLCSAAGGCITGVGRAVEKQRNNERAANKIVSPRKSVQYAKAVKAVGPRHVPELIVRRHTLVCDFSRPATIYFYLPNTRLLFRFRRYFGTGHSAVK